MNKKVSMFALSLLLTSCGITRTGVPIRSVTHPAPRQEIPHEDVSAQPEPDFISQEPVSVEKTPIVQPEPKRSMIDEVNATKPPIKTDVVETNFGALGSYKIGNPYLIDGVSYYPHEDYTYSEIGMASWYGPDFHGGNTSNGEIFDANTLTAAHRTLPMPSLVRVTNLENGISLNVKVNDRGPYARDRIIDLSSAAAEILEIKQRGTARVKVEIIPDESRRMKDLAVASRSTDVFNANVSYVVVNPMPSQKTITPIIRDSQQTALISAPAPVVTPTPPAFTPMAVPTPPAPIAVPAPPAPVVVPAPSSIMGDYFVQIAAYATYEKAEEMKDKLTHLGTVKIFKGVTNGNTLYKVRLGEFKTQDEAKTVQQSVIDTGIKGSRIILKKDGAFRWK